MREHYGWFLTQAVHRDSLGNKTTRQLCVTDQQIAHFKFQEHEIEFVHELYFVIITDTSICVPLGYDFDTCGIKHYRYIVKVAIVNGIFKTAYPVLYDPVLLWHQYQLQGHAPPMSAIPMTLADALMRTTGNKLSLNVFQCLELDINALLHQVEECLLSVANGIDSVRTYRVQIYLNPMQLEHVMIFIPRVPQLSIHFDLNLLWASVMQNLPHLWAILVRNQMGM